ncbi:hypothetical protein CO662_34820 [Rhizobium anhuiense]|uniref:Uncharacterized protein n=2 Tax=Rhizobium TaxID=379 RepID=A0A3S0QVX9_9HYPH|nr:hypothetical protein RPHASCH2410_PC01210 [Rhizobium phaseoli Ch24-10]PDS34628.1 hypothetical protein CO665_30120 [Rhizobium anhuiense]PDS81809.1 hypothetical protein CO654_28540 [Rhizobium sp. L18]PDT26012.1 hypothetical protein CO660_30505 [Rhizobium sp. L9]PDV85709.1 hypothetical protein CO652_24955 [Rhizobium sp. H4]RSB87224.1 hypothetical protein EFR00_26615 [Rhizobium sophoriradicis]RUM03685.1 hypothetical protein EFR84_19615 [Rhizobium chutanense]RUM14824.1 hypothetical protein EFD5
MPTVLFRHDQDISLNDVLKIAVERCRQCYEVFAEDGSRSRRTLCRGERGTCLMPSISVKNHISRRRRRGRFLSFAMRCGVCASTISVNAATWANQPTFSGWTRTWNTSSKNSSSTTCLLRRSKRLRPSRRMKASCFADLGIGDDTEPRGSI